MESKFFSQVKNAAQSYVHQDDKRINVNILEKRLKLMFDAGV